MNRDLFFSTTSGACWGFALGALLIAVCSYSIGGPVVAVAKLSILTMTTLPGAALGLLSHFERA